MNDIMAKTPNRPKSPTILVNDILSDLRDENHFLKTKLSESQELIEILLKFKEFLIENKCDFCLCHSNEKITELVDDYNECERRCRSHDLQTIESNIVTIISPKSLSIEDNESCDDSQFNDTNDSQSFADIYGHQIDEEFEKISKSKKKVYSRLDSTQVNSSPHNLSEKLSLLVSREEFKSRGRLFTCNWEECDHKFALYSQYVRHYQAHCQYRPFKCPYCDHSSGQRANMKSHIERVHKPLANHSEPESDDVPEQKTEQKKKVVYNCDWVGCGLQFRRYDTFRQHISRHEGSQFVCTKCEENFEVKSHLDKHIEEKHSTTKLTKKCSYEELNYQLNAAAIETYVINKSELRDKYTRKGLLHLCEWTDCEYSCQNWALMRRHLLIHIDVKPYTCIECQKSFRQKYFFIMHLKSMHSKVEDISELIQISLGPQLHHKFSDALQLIGNHIEAANKVRTNYSKCESDDLDTDYICDWFGCGVTLRYDSYAQHMAEHEGSQFDNQSLSGQHTTEKHMSSETIVHKKRFKRSQQIANKITKKYSSDKLNKQLSADAIETYFINKTELRNKYVIQGLQYLCKWPKCQYYSQGWSLMRRHLLVHSKVKPYQCIECKKSFGQKNFLIKHMDSWHSNKEDMSQLVQIALSHESQHKMNEAIQLVANNSKESTPFHPISQEATHTKSISNHNSLTFKHQSEFNCSYNKCGFRTHLEQVFNYHMSKHNTQ